MIRSLMYLTASRYDIQFSTCLCARYQANPKESHLIAVKRIFKYLKAMSSAKAEYVASAGCCANILCMKSQLTNYDIIYEKDIELHFFLTQYQLADIFTKPPDEPTFKRLIVELGGKTGGHDQISNKDAIILYGLANGVEIDFAKVIWEDIIHKLNKKSRKNFVPYPRSISLLLEYMMPEYENDELTLNSTQVFSVHYWALKPNQPEGPPLIDHMLAICKACVLVKSKAPKTLSKAEKRVSQGKMSEAKIRIRRKQSSKHTSEYKTEANKEVDTNPSQPLASTLVVAEMHKEDQQAAGGPTSLGVTSEDGANPQLSSAKSCPLEISDLMILLLIHNKDENEEEEEADKYEDTHATSHEETKDSSNQKLEQLKNKAKAEFSFLTAQRSYLNVGVYQSLPSFCLYSIIPGLLMILNENLSYLVDWKEISTQTSGHLTFSLSTCLRRPKLLDELKDFPIVWDLFLPASSLALSPAFLFSSKQSSRL
ncbi:hypothetical protein Tco_1359811 [Tanacetum coccineum]